MDLKKFKKIHFVGIGGIGVSAIARMMLAEGKKISGSDFTDSELVEGLRKLGAKITIGQEISDIPKDTDLIIYSTAIEVADKEFYKKLKKLKIPSISYAEALSLVSKDKFTIAISGTHGKTTTTGMVAKILMDAGLEPTVIIGSLMNVEGEKGQTSNGKRGLTLGRTNFVAGKGKHLVVEVDEYQRKFLSVFPQILVINNIDEDHLDYFKDLADIQEAFSEFAGRVPKDGFIVTDFSHQNVTPAVSSARATMIDYKPISITGLKMKFPGEHNRQNARAALAVASVLGIDLKKAIESLNNFSGTWRRFEYLGKTKKGALVYDDYAHNPQKVKAVLSGTKEFYPKERIIAVFQPHLYSRTKTLLPDFAKSFGEADMVILAPIFPAREAPDPAISSEILADLVKKNYPDKKVKHISTFEEIADFLNKEGKNGDIILTIGAGDVYKIAHMVVNSKLQKTNPKKLKIKNSKF